TLERQLSKSANIALTYLNSRGVHALLTRNINAPVGPTFDPKDVSERPFGTLENTYQYEGAGIFKQNQFIVNSSVRVGQKVSLFGYYTLNYANGDTSSTVIPGFPTNQYNVSQDYGRAPFDVRHRVFLGGSITMPMQFRLSPFVIASSGSPFNITTGQDTNGDSIYNDRPTFGALQTALTAPNFVMPQDVTLSCNEPSADTRVPINCATGPARFSFNLRLSKTFGFGQKKESASGAGGGGMGGGTFGRGPGGPGGAHGGRGGPMGGGDSSGQRYSLTFSVAGRNIFNNVNAGNPVGVISSPIFGQSNSLAGGPFGSSSYNRRLDLQV